jgi:hypothetical protein
MEHLKRLLVGAGVLSIIGGLTVLFAKFSYIFLILICFFFVYMVGWMFRDIP